MTSPFLLRYARPCNSRKTLLGGDASFYDVNSDMRRLRQGAATPLLIDVPAAQGPRTKKEDIERGEDKKDRRMWR